MDHANVPAHLRITDDDLEASRATVRALVVSRYEALWKPVENALSVAEDPALPVDPRLLELGVRITKELSQLYELNRRRNLAPEEEEDEGLDPAVDRRALVLARLEEIEERARNQPTL